MNTPKDSPAAQPRKLIRIALVEDVAEMRESWKSLIDSIQGFNCSIVCDNGLQALREIPRQHPDVVVMDINMPGMDGIECTARMKQKLPDTPILILTVSASTDTIFRALEAGADGYLLKRSRPEQLETAIREVLEGGAPMTSEIARRVVASFRRRPALREERESLTPREEEVLMLLSKGFANKEIADKLAVSCETVRVHLKHIYDKLHVRSRTEAVARYLSSPGTPPTS